MVALMSVCHQMSLFLLWMKPQSSFLAQIENKSSNLHKSLHPPFTSYLLCELVLCMDFFFLLPPCSCLFYHCLAYTYLPTELLHVDWRCFPIYPCVECAHSQSLITFGNGLLDHNLSSFVLWLYLCWHFHVVNLCLITVHTCTHKTF